MPIQDLVEQFKRRGKELLAMGSPERDKAKFAWSGPQLLHVYVEVAQGRGKHGDFLKSFALAVARADIQNFAILREAAEAIADKHEFHKYLDTFDGGEASTA